MRLLITAHVDSSMEVFRVENVLSSDWLSSESQSYSSFFTRLASTIDASPKSQPATKGKSNSRAEKHKQGKPALEIIRKRALLNYINGIWTQDSRITWRLVFTELSARSGTTSKIVWAQLNSIRAGLNDYLEEKRSLYQVSMAIREDNKGSTFYIMLLGPRIKKTDNIQALLDDKERDTVIRIGSMNYGRLV
jgi:hypothetical protein